MLKPTLLAAVALREIKRYQKSTELLIAKLPFTTAKTISRKEQ